MQLKQHEWNYNLFVRASGFNEMPWPRKYIKYIVVIHMHVTHGYQPGDTTDIYLYSNELILGNFKYVFPCCITSACLVEGNDLVFFGLFNIMVVDGLATHGVRASVAKMLNWISRNIPASTPEWVISKQTDWDEEIKTENECEEERNRSWYKFKA